MDQRYIERTPASPSTPPYWLQPRMIVIGTIALFALLMLWLAAFNTQAGTVDIVLRWGAPVRVTEPGSTSRFPTSSHVTPSSCASGPSPRPTSRPRATPWS
jgi:hypothetical protein